jgi:alpha-L-fucosidase
MHHAHPTPGQLAWQNLHFGMFFHFGINTFFNKEWSDGSLPASGFNPTDLNCDDWLATAKQAGIRYAILTAKHHDGFCLWPTATTDYSVASSPWRNGTGDVVAEFIAACHRHDIRPGLYLSPWDRNHPAYPDAKAYDAVYCQQLNELCTRYGDLVELWFDGAGSEGRTYDWDAIMAVVERHQPRAQIFNMGKPTIRWVGNEDGLASEPVHYAVSDVLASAFSKNAEAAFDAPHYLPPECDVAIRRNWFWQNDDIETLKSVDALTAIWYRSIGLGCNLLLNVPPDRRGRLDPADRERLLAFSRAIDQRFARPHSTSLSHSENSVTVQFSAPTAIDHLWIEEDVSAGQRVQTFSITDAESGVVISAGKSIGTQRVVCFPECTVNQLLITLVGEQPRLLRVVGHCTGYDTIPAPAAPLNYAEWAAKSDQP